MSFGDLFNRENIEKAKTIFNVGRNITNEKDAIIDMQPEHKKACQRIIHSASTAAGTVGAGLAQLPCADSTVIIPIQTAMTIALGRVFDRDIPKSAATATAATALSTTVGRGASQVLVGWIPIMGNVINASTAAAVTEAAGWLIAQEFSKEYKKDHPESAPKETEDEQN